MQFIDADAAELEAIKAGRNLAGKVEKAIARRFPDQSADHAHLRDLCRQACVARLDGSDR